MADHYNHASHCKYSLQYHIIWCPKFRYQILLSEKQESLKNTLTQICTKYSYHIKALEVKALEVMPDHIHIFLSAPQTVAPCDIVRTLKSCSSISMFRQYPDLKAFYARAGSLWSRGYYIATVGHISETAVRKYIEEQKSHVEEETQEACSHRL